MSDSRTRAPSDDEARVLLLPPTSRDGEVIAALLGKAGIACARMAGTAQLCAAVNGGGVGAVLISEEALADGADALAACVAGQPVWSDLPLLVLARTGAESPRLAATLSRLGSVSVVERPVRTNTLLSLIRSALRARARQYEVRAHLAELAEAGRALRAGEARYRLLVDNLQDYAIVMTDTGGRVVSWNAGAARTLGYTAEETLGKPAAIFFTDEDRATGVPEKEMAAARERGQANDFRWHLRKGGERFFVDGVMAALRDDTGALRGFAKLMRDVTDQRRASEERERLLRSEQAARAEAERQGRMKDEFLATLSHELRTPLNAILGWSQILQGTREPTAEDVQEGLAVIARNARAQTQIIEDMLDMSRIISGKLRMDVQRVELAGVIQAAVHTVRPAADAKGIRIESVLDPRAGPVGGDPSRLQQVFWNLLSNAVKFTPRGGRVQVRLEQSDAQVQVSVVDTGEGIDAEFLPHIFERFRQADGSTTRRHGGLGLGLAIVKQLIELHGGTIRANSPGRGGGSAFTVALPLTAAHVEPADSAPPPPPPPPPPPADPLPAADSTSVAMVSGDVCDRLAGLRVLVVDDEPDARAMLRRLLEDCHAVVSTASTAAEALTLLRADRPEVLVSDIGMPGSDGYELIRRIRDLSPAEGGQTPAVALTAYARADDRVRAVVAGFEHHVAKPVEPAELIAVIASAARRPR